MQGSADPIQLAYDAGSRLLTLRVPPDSKVTLPQVMDALARAGYDRFELLQDKIAQAIGAPGQDAIVIGECKSAEAEAVTDANGLAASLRITPAKGGDAITHEACLTALANANIVHGIDDAALASLIQQSMAPDCTQPVSAVVARATDPVHGQDSSFKSLVMTLKDRIMRPSERQDGSIDFHDLGEIPMVRTGTPLVQRSPPDPGTPGTNVHGDPIAPIPGAVVAFASSAGSKVSPDDPDLLIAAMDGMPVGIDKGMNVENVYKSKSITVATGNIHFDGSVIVEGDVTTGFTVFGSGDVTVNGVVESAQVTAGNDVFIKGGISGNLASLTGTEGARIMSGNTLFAGFAQFAELHAKNGIICTNFVLNCNLLSQDWIKLGGDKPAKSKVMGGELRARNLIKVDVAGSPNEVRTRLEIYHDSAHIREQKHAVEALIVERDMQLKNVENLEQQLHNKKHLPHYHEMVRRSDAMKHRLQEDMKNAVIKLRRLESHHDEWVKNAKIVIAKRAFPGTEFVIGERRITLTEELGPCTIQYGEEGLIFHRGRIDL